MPTPENDAIHARLEELGPNQVRLLISSGGLPTGWNVRVAEWLAIKDQEERRFSESSQAEQIQIARAASSAAERAATAAERASAAAERQAVAAEKANTRATIALAIAIVSIIATVISITVVHLDAIRQMAHHGTILSAPAPFVYNDCYAELRRWYENPAPDAQSTQRYSTVLG